MKKRTIVIVVAVIAVVIGVIAAVVGGILIGMAAVSFESFESFESEHPHESKHSLEFQTMRFERSDSSSIKKILTLDRTDDGVVIALGYEDMMSQEQEISHQKEFDRETLEEIEAVLRDYQVRDWGGFVGTNPNGVYDGSSFVFSCTLTDGSSFYASGSNKYPKHYRSVYQYLEGLLWRVPIQDTTFETESCTIRLPESWVGNTQAELKGRNVTFLLPLKSENVELFTLEFSQKRPDKTSDYRLIGQIKSDETGEELFLGIRRPEDFGTLSIITAGKQQRKIYTTVDDAIEGIIKSIQPNQPYDFMWKVAN